MMEEQTPVKNEPKAPAQLFFYFFGLVMIVFYCAMGYLLAFTPIFKDSLSPAMRYGFGALFGLYGIFRAYRQIKKKRSW